MLSFANLITIVMIRRLRRLSVFTSSLEAHSLAQIYWNGLAISPLHLKNRFYFTTLPPPPQLSLSIKEQNAVVAFFALQYLMESSMEDYNQLSLSIRQRLVDRAIFSQFVLDKLRGREFSHRPFESLSQLGVSKQSLDEVMAGFQLDKGMRYNPIVWDLEEEEKSMPGVEQKAEKFELKRTVLHPFVHTGLIIRTLYSLIPCMISGNEGVGKSFAYLIYDYLASFIINCRIDKKEGEGLKQQSFKHILCSYFYITPKLVYTTIRKHRQYADYLQSLSLQNHGLVPIESFPISNLQPEAQRQTISNYAYELSVAFYMHKTATILLIDGAESYYDQVRNYKYLQNTFQRKAENKSERQMLFSKSDLIIAFHQSFQNTYLNSSRQIKEGESTKWLQQRGLYSFYTHGQKQEFNQYINYRKIGETYGGQLQLYMTFWFYISLILSESSHSKEDIARLRKDFLHYFNIHQKPTQKQRLPIVWVRQVSPRVMREVSFRQRQKIKQIMKCSIADEWEQVKSLLIALKQAVQRNDDAASK